MESTDTPVRRGKADDSGWGGKRANAGRKPGSSNRMSKAAREAARESGLLPHEILLSIARGHPQVLRVPTGKQNEDGSPEIEEKLVGVDLESIKDAAKAAAPYYAPKLSTVETIQGVSDDDLNEFIKSAAAEAGLSVSDGGGSEAEEDQAAEDTAPRRKRIDLA